MKKLSCLKHDTDSVNKPILSLSEEIISKEKNYFDNLSKIITCLGMN